LLQFEQLESLDFPFDPIEEFSSRRISDEFLRRILKKDFQRFLAPFMQKNFHGCSNNF